MGLVEVGSRKAKEGHPVKHSIESDGKERKEHGLFSCSHQKDSK